MVQGIFNDPWIISLGSAIVGGLVVALIIYYVFGIGKPKSTVYKPKVSFYPKGPYSNGAVFLEIYNSGNEDVENIKITIRYQTYDEKKQKIWEEREIDRFINETDDYLFTKPAPLNILRVGEKKLGSGFRSIAIDKLVEVKFFCEGMTSGKVLETSTILETARDERPN